MSISREVLKTACNRDCPDACTLEVRLEGGRVHSIGGSKDDPVTRGFICDRTRRFATRQYAEDRIRRPLLRRDGVLEPIGWDEALDLAAEKLLRFRRESGPGSILHYRSGGSLGVLKHTADLLFQEFGPCATKRGDICSGGGDAAQELDFGINESHDLFDLRNSRTIVLWGKNPHTSGVHLLPILREARERGATIIGCDPVRTKVAGLADLFLWPRPGADHAVAFGMARWLFENDAADPEAPGYCDNFERYRELVFSRDLAGWAKLADLPVADLERAAQAFGRGRPAAILVGWGLARRLNGAAAVRALDALGAVSGNLGIPGGGVSYYFGRRRAFDTEFGVAVKNPPRTFCEPTLGRDILAADPGLRMIWVTAGNPLAMLPDAAAVRRAFESVEFKVVVETHHTDTTDVADLVLPTLSLLEDEDLVGAYGNHWLRSSRPVVAPEGEARHEFRILQDLARRLGLGATFAGEVRDWKRKAMRRLEAAGIRLENLESAPARNPFAAEVLFADRKFPTPTGRVNLIDHEPSPAGLGDAGYPFTLLAVSTPKAQSSQWSVPLPEGPAPAWVHPQAARGFADGAIAWLESRLGRLEVRVRHDAALRPEIVLMEKGGAMRDGRCANLLVSARTTDRGEGAAYYDEPVRLVEA